MTHENDFLQTIIENPEDDVPRLIYADWLDENNQPDRAEFIRIQCRLVKLPPEDPRRQELEARKEQLWWVAYREKWVQKFGVAMTWENVLALFKWRLEQTIAWCRSRQTQSLRTPTLEPSSDLAQFASSSNDQDIYRFDSTDQWEAYVNHLANRRAKHLSDVLRCTSGIAEDMASGRLLLFDPYNTMSDGAAEQASNGFFDVDNVPPWDTWVWYAGERTLSQGYWRMFGSCLIAWVPPHLLELVESGIRVNPEECILWAENVDNPFTRKLRSAGLLS